MLVKEITYTDFNGEERKEVFYFNLSKAEITEMELEIPGGMTAMLQKITATKDTPSLIKIFKDLILRSYGEKAPDGRAFIKVRNGVRLSEEFSQTQAYSELFMQLATDAKAASDFVNGIVDASLSAAMNDKKTPIPAK